MTQYVHKLSAILFYTLGSSFFLAYLLAQKGIVNGYYWLKIADLPLAAVAMVYGGTSLYLSLKPDGTPGKALGWTIGFILLLTFIFVSVLNFWELL